MLNDVWNVTLIAMTVQEQAMQLGKAEKLALLEALWADLRESESDFNSPEWHGTALRETATKYTAGEVAAVDWDTAKQMLRDE